VDKTPKVSIGLPVYNGEKFVACAIESVLAQDMADLELIISDNASTDTTFEICQSYAGRDSRIRLTRNETNLGAAPNLNKVARLARGQYYKWAAHDDWCAPDFLSKCLTVLESDPSVVMCYPQTCFYHADGTFDQFYKCHVDASSGDPASRFLSIMRELHEDWIIFGVIRRQPLMKTGLYPAILGGDRILLVELAMQGRFVELPEYLQFARWASDVDSARDIGWWDSAKKNVLPLRRARLASAYMSVAWKSDMSLRQKLRTTSGIMSRASAIRRIPQDFKIVVERTFRRGRTG
jgi:glycosyltransferase involved in cell wall biosynthesis